MCLGICVQNVYDDGGDDSNGDFEARLLLDVYGGVCDDCDDDDDECVLRAYELELWNDDGDGIRLFSNKMDRVLPVCCKSKVEILDPV